MKNNLRLWMTISCLLLLTAKVNAQSSDSIQHVSLKTNLLYDITATFNLGAEFRTGNRTSLDIPLSWNPFTFSDNRKWKHFLLQPEFRLWTKETFNGHFFGLHAHYAYYNVGNLPHGPFSRNMADSRYEGQAIGAGLSYGYRVNFTDNWGLEAAIGLGYAYLDYDKYECASCGDKMKSDTRNYFGPTKAGISLIYTFGNKAKKSPERVYAPVIVQEEPKIYEPQFMVSFVTPEAEEVKHRSESGRAYLDFAVGQSEIVAGFMDNAAELQRIYTLIETVQNNPDATITGITITGYASPEGNYQSNLSLSDRRAQALKRQVKNLYGFPENLFKVDGRGEDWAMLDTLVNRSYMEDKYAALEIIRSRDSYDNRENRLKALNGGTPYRYLYENIYPRLRRSDYELHYTVAPFTVEKGKEVLRTNPAHLSLNELFLIAGTYAKGSDAFNEVFETAARLYPNDDTANLNAAASALSRKDKISAARYLDRVVNRGSEYWNNAGILVFLTGNNEVAAEYFAKARLVGGTNAAELEKHCKSLPKK